MEKIIEFLIVFIVVAIIYYIFFGRKNKKYDKKNLSVELAFLIYVYDIDPKKINYNKFSIACTLINAFIIGIVYIVVVYLVKDLLLQILIGIILLFLLIVICYGLLARYYIGKGMVKKCTTLKK